MSDAFVFISVAQSPSAMQIEVLTKLPSKTETGYTLYDQHMQELRKKV